MTGWGLGGEWCSTHTNKHIPSHDAVDIFLCMVAQELFPAMSIPLYAHHRAFYVVENAANLYPTSCYYLAIILMELVLNAVNGGLLAAQMYYFHNFAAFFLSARPWAACAGYAGFVMLLNAAVNVRTYRPGFGIGCAGVSMHERTPNIRMLTLRIHTCNRRKRFSTAW